MSAHLPKTPKERPQVPKIIPKLDTKSLEIAVNAKSESKVDTTNSNTGLEMTAGSSDFDGDRMSPPPDGWLDGRLSPSKTKSGRLVSTPFPVPASERRVDRRFWPRDTRGLLEMCEQGYQLQQGMKTHCQDTTTALEQLVVSCQSTVNEMLAKLEETCNVMQKEAARPANVDWSPIYMEFNDKISPAIVASVLQNQEATVSRFEDQIAAQISQIVKQLSGSIGTLDEVQKLELVGLRQELREVQKGAAAFEESTIRSQEQMLNALREQQEMLNGFVTSRLQEVLDGVEDNKKHLSGIEPLLENQLTKQLQEAKDHDTQHRSHIKDIHRVVHADFGQLFNEIGTIQKAMNLPFAKLKRNSKSHESIAQGNQLREYWTQTDAKDSLDCSTQTDTSITMPPDATKKKKDGDKKRYARGAAAQAVAVIKDKQIASGNLLLADEEAKKKKMREQLIKPQYNVADFYHDTGCAQQIAKSYTFENLTFLVIFLNAIWIAVDTDNNDATLIYDAEAIYQIVENLFCSYFSFELSIRFAAFRKKRDCVKDFWFVFDALLVTGMIVETWVVHLIYIATGKGNFSAGGGVGDLSLLRLIRLVKVFRMARMARLLRSVPELVMIMKGMGVAFRSVSFFVLLAVVVLYIFAVAFRQLTKDTETGDKYFPTVPRSMGYLLLDGMLPIYAPIVNNVSSGRPYLWPIILIFILLSSVTILNMLVGVLTEVVRTVAATEKDAMTVTHVTQQLREVLGDFQKNYDCDESYPPQLGRSPSVLGVSTSFRRKSVAGMTKFFQQESLDESLAKLSKKDFETFLTKPDVMKIIQDVGVDVVGLLDNADVIYEDKDKEGVGLSFVDFIDVVLNLRGSNPATVKDIKEMQRILKSDMHAVRDRIRMYFGKEMAALKTEMVEHFVHLEHKDSDSDDNEPRYSKPIAQLHVPDDFEEDSFHDRSSLDFCLNSSAMSSDTMSLATPDRFK